VNVVAVFMVMSGSVGFVMATIYPLFPYLNRLLVLSTQTRVPSSESPHILSLPLRSSLSVCS
jgi:hypothetical protein